MTMEVIQISDSAGVGMEREIREQIRGIFSGLFYHSIGSQSHFCP